MSALNGYNELKIGTSVGTTNAKVLAKPVDVAIYDMTIANTDATATVTVCFASTTNEANAATTSTFDTPPGVSRTLRNVPTSAGDVYAKSSTATTSVLISQSPASDAAGR